MDKRQFLSSTTGVLVGSLASSTGSATNSIYATDKKSFPSQTILTIIGDIKHANRGKSEALKDQLMYKQGIRFDCAYTFSLADLEKLPVTTINPTMKYDGRPHKLSGPRLMDVLAVVGAKELPHTQLIMRGIDGYSPEVSLSHIKQNKYILATRLDGELLAIGGFGPLFAIFDLDRIDEYAKKPLNQRFETCSWGVYCIEVVT